jgi:rfaE bifunctional protein nucleotidyltransferase chain/domain
VSKIYTDIARLNRQLQTTGDRKIVFTNGVFDIIHPGHIALLQFARDKGDLLIVGINDDDSVKRLKGNRRPIFALSERLEVLEAIEAVDFIIPFSEDTPLRLIEGLYRIDVLVKGGDYRVEEVVGRKEVEASGGEVCIFPIQSHLSTSAIIEKIKRDI